MRLIYLGLAWVFGIFLGMRYLHSADWIYLAIPLGASLLSAILFRHKRTLLLGGLFFAFLFGGILRFQFVPTGDALQGYQGDFHIIRGVVATDPKVGEYSTTFHLDVTEIQVNKRWKEVSGTLQVYAPKFPSELARSRELPYYRYGDLLEMAGVLKSPSSPEEGEGFNFREYLARQGIYTVMYEPRGIKLLATGQKFKPMELIYHLRGSISRSLEKVMPEPQCSLAKAMLLGQRRSIPGRVEKDFSRTGTAHLLAISGVHVGIIAGIALSAGILIFGRHRPYYVLLALALVWFYVILSGMRASGIRAAIMGSLWLYADWIGRPRSAFTALVFAASLMLAFDPQLLATVGFQLSFAAMAGLIFLTPMFNDWSKRAFAGKTRELSSAVNFVIGSCSVTLGAVLATLPLIAYYFHMIPLVSLPATFFTLPAVPGIIATAALTGLVGIFATGAASVIGWVSWVFITYVLKAVEAFAAIPFASASVGFTTPSVCAYYGILVLAIWIPRNWRKLSSGSRMIKKRISSVSKSAATIPTKWVVLPLLVLAVLVWSMALTTPDSRLHISVLDVGQGDSILIQRGTQEILIDGGPSSKKLMNRLGDEMPFWDRDIELVVLTHPDSDHITGLVGVLKRYEVDKVLTSGQKGDSGAYIEWRKLIKEKDIQRVVARKGQVISMGKSVKLKVLHPSASQLANFSVNNNSVVLRLTDGNFSLLLTGDIEAEAERFLLNENVRLRSTVLKVAHHGSSKSTTASFLSAVHPMVAVISVGAHNRFGQPSEKVVNRLEEAVGKDRLFSTSKDGTVELVTNGRKLWVGGADRD